MEQFLYIFIHLGLPLILLLDYILRKVKSKTSLLVKTLFNLSILVFLYNWGQWPLVGSYYLRYVIIALILIVLYLSIKRWQSLKISRTPGIWNNILLTITSALTVFLIVVNINIIRGMTYSSKRISMAFPLKNGQYYVASGGSNKLINNHMRNFPNAQEFALDINRLGRFKAVSKKLLSNKNEDHYIFSDTVYCPCDGRILEIENDAKDNLEGSMEVSSEKGTGNFVNIECDEGYFVFIPHLKQYSVLVISGNLVKKGNPLGQVGISGFSQEPHLHIQASKYNSDSLLVGIPITFEDKSLVRNDIFNN